MNETMVIEAIRAADGPQRMAEPIPAAADPQAVNAFQMAMGGADVKASDAIPFIDQVRAAWQTTQVSEQAHVHRMSALADLTARSPSFGALAELQYHLAEAGFQLEITTIVAKKTSDAVSTLVKNG